MYMCERISWPVLLRSDVKGYAKTNNRFAMAMGGVPSQRPRRIIIDICWDPESQMGKAALWRPVNFDREQAGIRSAFLRCAYSGMGRISVHRGFAVATPHLDYRFSDDAYQDRSILGRYPKTMVVIYQHCLRLFWSMACTPCLGVAGSVHVVFSAERRRAQLAAALPDGVRRRWDMSLPLGRYSIGERGPQP